MAIKSNLRTHLAISIFLLTMTGLIQAATITVGPGADYNFDTIQAGIGAANDGDEVLVAPGEYVITEPITFRKKAITVQSEAGPDETTIRMGTPANTNRGSVVIFENSETFASVLDGFTITGGSGSIRTNSPCGGGIFFNASLGTVKNCTIVQNRVRNTGGGIVVGSGSSAILTDCIILQNTAQESLGGGVCCYDNSSMNMTNCTIAENSAKSSGGGVFCGKGSHVTMTNCVITRNTTTGFLAGGVCCVYPCASMTIRNCTICGNSGSVLGGGVACRSSSVTIINSIIWGNTATMGRQVSLDEAGSINLSYSNVAGGQVGIVVEDSSILNWGMGNINVEPCFADPVNGDYHLKSEAGRWNPYSESWVSDEVTSPCIDRGDPNSPVAFESDPNGGIINMGAYGGTLEASMSIGILPPLPPIAHWKLDETEGDIAHDSVGEYDGQLYGDPVWQPTDGMIDGALMLDGIDDLVGTWEIPALSEEDFSMFVWIKGGTPGQVVISEFNGVNWLMADVIAGYLSTDLGDQPLVSEVNITDGNWHRVGVIWDRTNLLLYVDDVAVASDTQNNLERSIVELNIGCGSHEKTGTFFFGLIDDVRIYNRAITP